jgi:hypothetical protein
VAPSRAVVSRVEPSRVQRNLRSRPTPRPASSRSGRRQLRERARPAEVYSSRQVASRMSPSVTFPALRLRGTKREIDEEERPELG